MKSFKSFSEEKTDAEKDRDIALARQERIRNQTKKGQRKAAARQRKRSKGNY